MTANQKRALRVFLCHASGDKATAKKLYDRLLADGVDPWLDKEKLLPGQDWDYEIRKAVRESDAILICLSQRSTTKEGYVQKEIKMALDIADEKLEDTIYMIPTRFDDVEVPHRLSRWQWVDLFEDEGEGYKRLMQSLMLRAKKVDARVGEPQLDNTTFENELQRLYSDGLEAYHTEQWDRAIYCFQAFLAERPNSESAIQKLNVSKENLELKQLYEKALNAEKSASWREAIQTFETILGRKKDYKDVISRLENAKNARHLAELYGEAETLYAAEAWAGVISVFKKIYKKDPKYPDTKNLLKQAQKKFETAEEQHKIAQLYAQALEKLDAQEFTAARRLLKQVQRKSPDYREVVNLLEKTEKSLPAKKKLSLNLSKKQVRLATGFGILVVLLLLLYFTPAIGRFVQPNKPFIKTKISQNEALLYKTPNLKGDPVKAYLWDTATYEICMYDISAKSFLISHSYANCDSQSGEFGWLSATYIDLGENSFWDLFPYIQY